MLNVKTALYQKPFPKARGQITQHE